MPEGNVILVGNERLEVAAACNGLSMLMSLAATVAATASLVPMANWKRVVLLPSIIPIALGEQRPADRRDGLVLPPVRGRGGQQVRPRRGRLADDADGDGPGGPGAGDHVVADRRVRGGRAAGRPAAPGAGRRRPRAFEGRP